MTGDGVTGDAVTADRAVPAAGDRRPAGLGPGGWLRWGWRQLTSMRTALVLLLLLAVAAVPGSVLPQRNVDPTKVSDYLRRHGQLGPGLDRLHAFDVYSSPWFSAIYLLLFVSLVGCLVPRGGQHLRSMRARPPATPRNLARLPERHRWTSPLTAAAALELAGGTLCRRRYRVDVRAGPGAEGGSVAAERGYLRETGNLVFHVALVGVLVSVATGSLLGYQGQRLVPVGGSFANTLTAYDSFDPGAWYDPGRLPPFSVTLDSLRVRFEDRAQGSQFGAPREFQAAVSVRDGVGAAPRRARIEVNHPLQVAGASVYLSGNGYAPVITVRDAKGRIAFTGSVPFLPQDGVYTSTGIIKVSESAPQLGFQGVFLPTAVVDPRLGARSVFPDAGNPRLFLTGWSGDLGLDQGVPQSVYRLDTTRMTQLRQASGDAFRAELAPGDTVPLPGGAGTLTFDRLERFASFDVRHHPATAATLAFALLAIGGLAVSLFVPRRRVWLRALPSRQGGSVLEVAALARGQDAGLAAEVGHLVAAVRAAEASATDRPDHGRGGRREGAGVGVER